MARDKSGGQADKHGERNRNSQRQNDREDRAFRKQHDTRKSEKDAFCPRCHVWYDSGKDNSHAGH